MASPHAQGDPSRHVELGQDHPGFRDDVYRARRNEIAHAADTFVRGSALPKITYTETETRVWGTALEHLRPLHARYACAEYLAAWEPVGFVPSAIPSFDEVCAVLAKGSNVRLEPVAGLVTPRQFMERLADDVFLATQYIRHESMPLYTPEPDVIHEFVGHVPLLYDARFAAVNRLFGEATKRTEREEDLLELIRLYWYTLEFGAVGKAGNLHVYGAGLLSSFGELERFEKSATLKPFDIDVIAKTPFDTTTYQDTIFVAPNLEMVFEQLTARLSH